MAESESDVAFANAILEQVPVIDESLTDATVPIADRPFIAATLFVDLCIQEIKGDTKEDYLVKPWFKFIYGTITQWYDKKYGAAAKSRTDERLIGMCLFRGAAFLVAVPSTRKKIEEPGQSAWFTIAASVDPTEDPLAWVITPPNLDNLDHDERQSLLKDVVKVATCLRMINADLMTIDRPDAETGGWANQILMHLRQSAELLTSSKLPQPSMAAWHAHQAAESALKVLCRQHSGTHTTTHELSRLCDDLAQYVLIDRALIDGLPSHKHVIKLRANEVHATLLEAVAIYRASIDLVAHCTDRMRRRVQMRDAGFLIRKAPWID